MIRRPAVLLLGLPSALLVASCRFSSDRPAEDDTAADTDTDADTDADTDTDTDADTDTDPTGIDWIVEVERDTDTYGLIGVEVVTYAITEGSPTGYRDGDGDDPRFFVLRPATFTDPDAAHPVLMWLHGSAKGVEDDEALSKNCGREGVANVVQDAVYEQHFLAREVAGREWMYVVPENTWCDLWQGLGADDPVDPAHHGAEHVQTVLDALVTGFDGLRADPEAVYGWGTSIGALGVAGAAARDERFRAIVLDSGPINPVSWYNLPAEQPYIEHVFGGPPTDGAGAPTEWYPNYARADATVMVADGGLRVPLFQIYNTYDELVPIRQNAELTAQIDAHYPGAGVRFFHHDASHHAPVGGFHVQTGHERPPQSYTSSAALAFLTGAQVSWFEAEDTCDPDVCRVEAESGSGETEAISPHSQGAAVARAEADGVGVMYSAAVPAEVPRGVPLTLMPVVAASIEGASPGDGVLLFELLRDGAVASSLTVRRGDLAAGADESYAALYDQVRATTWPLDLDGDGDADALPEGSAYSLRVTYHGRGTVYLDGFWAMAE